MPDEKLKLELLEGETVLLSDGEYSDYRVVGLFRVLKPFVIADVRAAVVAYWRKFRPDSYLGGREIAKWLVDEGYLVGTQAAEWHVGDYGDMEMIDDHAQGLAYFNGTDATDA